jgi:ribosomal protein L11 methyltransferase
MGAAHVLATDIDPQALEATYDNARANHCQLEIAAAGQMPAGKADVVIANILTNPLKVLAPALTGRVRRGGSLTLSGILESQSDEVIRTYAPLIKLTVWQRREGWVCLAGTKT